MYPVKHISGKYRIGLMAILIYCNQAESGIVNFMQAFKISKGSVINDLKKLSAKAEMHDVKLEYGRLTGYFFSGGEEKIRAFVFYVTAETRDNINTELLVAKIISHPFLDVYNKMTSTLRAMVKSLNVDMRPDYLALIVLFVSIMQVRTKAHRLLSLTLDPQGKA